MSSKNIVVFVVVLLVALMAAGCGGECEGTVMADGSCQTVVDGQYVTVPEKSAVQQGNDAVGKYVSPSVAPAGKQLIESIGAGNTSKMLNDFAERCGRFGGQVANVNVATLGCYK